MSRDDELKKREALEAVVKGLQDKHKLALDENEALKVEVQKGVEDIAKALGEGYNRCLGRVATAGFAVEGHSFDDYIRDFAASNHGGNV